MAGEDDQNINNQPPNPPPPTQQAPHTVSTIKLPILKKGEYDIWAMKMEHYLAHIDSPVWEVIQNGNVPVSISTDTQAEKKKNYYAYHGLQQSCSTQDVTSCSKECKESYVKLKKLYDEHREQLGDASIEIQAYTQALKKVEAQLVAHQQGQLWYEEKIRFMKIDLDDKTDVLTYHKKLLAEAKKEKEDLKAKVEKWHNSSKNLNILLNSQMSIRDKAGLGTSETENSPVNDRYAEGMHAVPPPMTGIYIPSGPDKEIDDSQFTYGPKQSKPSESDARSSDFNSCESNCSEETHESMPEPVVNKPKVVSEPKVWSDAPIIEEYESDSEDEHVSLPTKEQEKPSFAFINTYKHVKTPRQTVIEQNTCSQSPKPDKKDCSGLLSKKLVWDCGIQKACLVLNSPCFMVKSWLVQDQTVLGKDYSNLLIADSLLKTIWFMNAPCYGNEALASPKANGVCCDAEDIRCKFKIESENLTNLAKLSKVEGCGGLGGSRLTWGDKEVTMQYLELKGGDRGACKLLGDVIEVLGCLLEVLGCLKWVKMKEKGCRVHFISG
ncbi:hypothetical protein Tco_0143430 [Tanacetum coccineum]